MYSQNQEEIILEQIQDKYKFVVELGAGDGFHLSNTRYLIEKVANHILIDADNRGNSEVKEHKINRENIIKLLDKYNCPLIFDLLSIDLDGNDYWILEEILKYHNPRVIIAEFNACYEDSRAIEYDPNFTWQGDSYFGFTFEAGKKLMEKFNYKLCFQTGNMNMIFTKNETNNKVTYEKQNYFSLSQREDWVKI
jgi:hypothetical protein